MVAAILTAVLLALPWMEVIMWTWRPAFLSSNLLVLGMIALTFALPLAWSIRAQGWKSSRLFGPISAVVYSMLVTCLYFGEGYWHLRIPLYMISGLLASQLTPQEVRRVHRFVFVGGVVAAIYALLSYTAFRLNGGGPLLRPPASTPVLAFLLAPYNCGKYMRGWRLAGSMCNDAYFGLYMVVVFCLGVAGIRGRLRLGLFPVGLAWALTFSRGAFLAMPLALLVVASRGSRRLLLLAPLCLLLCIPFMRSHDWIRFSDPHSFGGRFEMLNIAKEGFLHSPLIGHGAVRGVMDTQYPRILYQWGLLGVASVGWVCFTALTVGNSNSKPYRAGVLAILVGGLGAEVMEVTEIALYVWALAGLAEAAGREEPSPGETTPPPDSPVED